MNFSLNYTLDFTYTGFGLICLNILFYIILLCNIFFIFFFFEQSKVKFLTDLKNVMKFPILGLSLFFALLSLAGMPPLSGFVIKFLTFVYIFLSSNFYIIILFSFLNFFFLFFYVQNIRAFLATNSNDSLLLNKQSYYFSFNTMLINYIIILSAINVTSIFYVEDVLYFINFIFSF